MPFRLQGLMAIRIDKDTPTIPPADSTRTAKGEPSREKHRFQKADPRYAQLTKTRPVDIEALGQSFDDLRARKTLIAILENPSSSENDKYLAAITLHESFLPHEDARRALGEALDGNRSLSSRVFNQLVNIDSTYDPSDGSVWNYSETQVPQLLLDLKNPRPPVRREAARLLRGAPGERVAKNIVPLLQDADVGVRVTAAGSLAFLGKEEGYAALQKIVDSEPLQIARYRAVMELSQLKDKRAVDPLLGAATKDPNGLVKARAIRGLAFKRNLQTLPLIEKALKDGPVEEHMEILQILGSLASDPDARTLLIRILMDPGRTQPERRLAAKGLVPYLGRDDQVRIVMKEALEKGLISPHDLQRIQQ